VVVTGAFSIAIKPPDGSGESRQRQGKTSPIPAASSNSAERFAADQAVLLLDTIKFQ
jgi:hypothetical protein